MANREERLAQNEAIFRAANEALRRSGSKQPGLMTFICECGDASCRDDIRMTCEEYAEVRRSDARFLLARGHEDDGDRVLDERDRFTIVEKVGAARDVVEGEGAPGPG